MESIQAHSEPVELENEDVPWVSFIFWCQRWRLSPATLAFSFLTIIYLWWSGVVAFVVVVREVFQLAIPKENGYSCMPVSSIFSKVTDWRNDWSTQWRQWYMTGFVSLLLICHHNTHSLNTSFTSRLSHREHRSGTSCPLIVLSGLLIGKSKIYCCVFSFRVSFNRIQFRCTDQASTHRDSRTFILVLCSRKFRHVSTSYICNFWGGALFAGWEMNSLFERVVVCCSSDVVSSTCFWQFSRILRVHLLVSNTFRSNTISGPIRISYSNTGQLCPSG